MSKRDNKTKRGKKQQQKNDNKGFLNNKDKLRIKGK